MDYDLDDEERAAVADARFDRRSKLTGQIIAGLVVLAFAGWIGERFLPHQPEAHASIHSPINR